MREEAARTKEWQKVVRSGMRKKENANNRTHNSKTQKKGNRKEGKRKRRETQKKGNMKKGKRGRSKTQKLQNAKVAFQSQLSSFLPALVLVSALVAW